MPALEELTPAFLEVELLESGLEGVALPYDALEHDFVLFSFDKGVFFVLFTWRVPLIIAFI